MEEDNWRLQQNMIGMLYENPPAQSGQYFKYLASNFGITKPSYADAATGVQGLGFTSLAPLIISGLSFVILFTLCL